MFTTSFHPSTYHSRGYIVPTSTLPFLLSIGGQIKKYKNKIKIYKEITTKRKYPKKTNEIKQRIEPGEKTKK